MNTTATAPIRSSIVPVAVAAGALAATLAAVGTFTDSGDNRAREFLIVLVIIAVTAVAVFGWVVPRALTKDSPVLALSLSLLGLAAVVVFWSGLPPVFAAAGALLGWSGAGSHRGAALSRAAVVIGGVALVADVVFFVSDLAGWF